MAGLALNTGPGWFLGLALKAPQGLCPSPPSQQATPQSLISCTGYCLFPWSTWSLSGPLWGPQPGPPSSWALFYNLIFTPRLSPSPPLRAESFLTLPVPACLLLSWALEPHCLQSLDPGPHCFWCLSSLGHYYQPETKDETFSWGSHSHSSL